MFIAHRGGWAMIEEFFEFLKQSLNRMPGEKPHSKEHELCS